RKGSEVAGRKDHDLNRDNGDVEADIHPKVTGGRDDGGRRTPAVGVEQVKKERRIGVGAVRDAVVGKGRLVHDPVLVQIAVIFGEVAGGAGNGNSRGRRSGSLDEVERRGNVGHASVVE